MKFCISTEVRQSPVEESQELSTAQEKAEV